MPSDHTPTSPPPPPPRRSVLRGGVIEPVDHGSLTAVVAAGPMPTDAEWTSAQLRGTLVVRSSMDADQPAWLPASRRAWDERLALLTNEGERRRVCLLMWPHAQDVVSDVPGLVMFCRTLPTPRTGAETAWGILLDPAAILTPDMLPNAEDHLVRLRDATTLDFVKGRVTAVVLRDEQAAISRWWREHADWAGVVVEDRRRQAT